jgi:hypothetical protein
MKAPRVVSVGTGAPSHFEPDSPGSQHTLEHVDQYLRIARESDASDIHLGVNAQPIWRRFGNLEPVWLQAPKLTAADTRKSCSFRNAVTLILPTPPPLADSAPASSGSGSGLILCSASSAQISAPWMSWACLQC